MMTVKEISELTGVSIRTLHYYDEIGLFSPTEKSEAGYRLYDEQALEVLQQILFLREFDIPLKEIKSIMQAPDFDRKQMLRAQKNVLIAERDRLNRLIATMEDILIGDNKMDFEVFNRGEIEELFQTMVAHMPKDIQQIAIEEFGGLAQWKEHYMEAVASEDMQRQYAKVVEWYGGKENYMNAASHPISREVAESYKKREDAIRQKLIAKRGQDIHSLEIREIIGEYGFVMKQLLQVKEEKGMMLSIARTYRQNPVRKNIDDTYGEGAAEFFACAIETFYGYTEQTD